MPDRATMAAATPKCPRHIIAGVPAEGTPKCGKPCVWRDAPLNRWDCPDHGPAWVPAALLRHQADDEAAA